MLKKGSNPQQMDTTIETMNIKGHIINVKVNGYDINLISSEYGCFDVHDVLYLLDTLGVDYIHRSVKNV